MQASHILLKAILLCRLEQSLASTCSIELSTLSTPTSNHGAGVSMGQTFLKALSELGAVSIDFVEHIATFCSPHSRLAN